MFRWPPALPLFDSEDQALVGWFPVLGFPSTLLYSKSAHWVTGVPCGNDRNGTLPFQVLCHNLVDS